MKAKDSHEEKSKTSNSTLPNASIVLGRHKAMPTIFYRVLCCPQCGEESLSLLDFGPHLRGGFLGMTSTGDKGCDRIELEGGHQYVVVCYSCGHQVFRGPSATTEQLMEWAVAEGQPRETLTFSCPVCGSHSLSQIMTGVEIVREVAAVYTIHRESETEPQAEIALIPDRATSLATAHRYRCSNGHELANDDGSPVENAEQLVEWLKTCSAGDPVSH